MKLYELGPEIAAIEQAREEWAAEHDGDVTGFPWDAQLDTLHGAVREKIIAIVELVKAKDAEVAAIRKEEKALAARRKALEADGERLKAYCLYNYPANKARITWARGEVSVADSPPAVVVEVAVADLPDRFKKVSYEVDKGAIREVLDSGENLEGIAHFEAGRYLRIR